MAMQWSHKGEKPQPPLHYTDCGLDDVYLVSGYEIVKTHDDEGIAVKNLDELHKAIGCYLAFHKKALAPKELRFLRKQMNLTQSDLGRLIGLSSQQVARWEKAVCEITGPADRLLRALYIQYVGNKLDLQKLAVELEEVDSRMNEKAYFAKTAQGWEQRKAA
jgi:DNA-binding transcriptional regulator YiaG